MTEKTISISQALTRVFRRHYDRDYYLPHVVPIIYRHKNKEESIAAIKERYGSHFRRELERHRDDPVRFANTQKWRLSVHELIVDLRGLSHVDFDVLTQFRKDEAMQRPITKINDKQIIMHKEDLCQPT